jgi:hypothetical protein
MKILPGKLYYVGSFSAYETHPDDNGIGNVRLSKDDIVMVLENVGGKFKNCYWILTEDGKRYWLHESGFIRSAETTSSSL